MAGLASLNEDLGFLLGFAAGDGSKNYQSKASGGEISAIRFHPGTDEWMAIKIKETIEMVYGVDATIQTREPKDSVRQVQFVVNCSRKHVAEDFLSYGPLGIHTWRVPDAIVSSSEPVKASYVKGFADADGHMTNNLECSSRYISLDSVNDTGLRQMDSVVNSIGIKTNFFGPYKRRSPYIDQEWSDAFSIRISAWQDIDTFHGLVGFESPAKMAELESAIASRKRFPMRRESAVELMPKLVDLYCVKGHSYQEISDMLGIGSREIVRDHLRRKFKPGPVPHPPGRFDILAPKVDALRREGKREGEISRILGVKQSAIWGACKYAKNHNLPMADPPSSFREPAQGTGKRLVYDLFAKDKTKSFSINDVSSQLGIGYYKAGSALHVLVKKGLLIKTGIGLYRFS